MKCRLSLHLSFEMVRPGMLWCLLPVRSFLLSRIFPEPVSVRDVPTGVNVQVVPQLRIPVGDLNQLECAVTGMPLETMDWPQDISLEERLMCMSLRTLVTRGLIDYFLPQGATCHSRTDVGCAHCIVDSTYETLTDLSLSQFHPSLP